MPNVGISEYSIKKQTEWEKKPIVGKFRLLRGLHNEGGVTYNVDDIIESRSDLLKHNNYPGRPKFERAQVYEPISTKPGNDGLNKKTIADLESIAREEEIDLGDATEKKDIIATIRKAMTVGV